MSRYGSAALAGELDRLELAGRGFRHRTLFSSACRLGELVAGGELDLDIAEGALIEQGHILGLADCDVRRQVARGIEKGRARPRKAPETGVTTKAETLAEVVRWWESVEANPPTGRSAGTTLRTLAGIRDLALSARKLRISESYREIAEASGVSVSTVYNRRQDWGPWVRRVSKGKRGRLNDSRTTWQLVVRERRALTNRPEATPSGVAGLFGNARTLADPSHNLWHRWSNGHRLYCLLGVVDATTTSALATATGLHPGTVRRIGARLVKLEVATHDEDGWRAKHVDISRVVELHVDGIDHAADRRLRHADDRELHRLRLAGRVAEAQRRPELTLVQGSATPEPFVGRDRRPHHEGVA